MKVRLFLVCIVFSLSALKLYAGNISNKEIRIVAKNAFYELSATKTKASFNEIVISNYFTKEVDNQTFYCAFNFKNGGFIIISGNNCIPPVLAYSLVNKYDGDNISPEFEWWMQNYISQIKYIKSIDYKIPNTVLNEWKRLMSTNSEKIMPKSHKGVEPMLHTQWNQGNYYNDMCPQDNAGPGGHVVTGCVATAMGQLLCYFRHPEQGVGEYSYIDENYGEQSVVFSEQNYNWDIMPVKLTSRNNEVAKLLYNLGVSVDMHYGPDGSGMTNHKAAYSLKTFFDYADSTQYLFRDSIDIDWTGVLISHLNQGIPLYYAGWSDTMFVSGHAFICDGYEDSTFFHFNWGWGGSFDGYFNIENLSPGGGDYTLMHEMVAYATPKNNYPHYFSGRKVLNAFEGIVDDGSGPVNNYQSSNYCEWLIDPQDSVSAINLEFLNFETLTSDSLIIYDGATTDCDIIASFAGNQLPDAISGSQSKMLIAFKANTDSSAGGFLFKFIAENPEYCTSGNVLTNMNGTISDGSENYQYLNSTDCSWTIQTEELSDIQISFVKLNTEPDVDYVRFYDAFNAIAIGDFSGNNLPEPFTVTTKKIKVFFRTNETVRYDGFSFDYSINTNTSEINSSVFRVFPNPTKNHLFIDVKGVNDIDFEVIIYSIDGKQLLIRKFNKSDNMPLDIDIQYLSRGIYFVHIKQLNSIYVERLFKIIK